MTETASLPLQTQLLQMEECLLFKLDCGGVNSGLKFLHEGLLMSC